MKPDIHPTYYPEATVTCACGESWTTGSTVEHLKVDVCSNCHPFFTGEQRIVDTEGQVDRFYKRLEVRQKHQAEIDAREAEKVSPARPITDLELGKRGTDALTNAGITEVGQFIEKLAADGEEGLLAIAGFGQKSLSDAKKNLRRIGYDLPETEA